MTPRSLILTLTVLLTGSILWAAESPKEVRQVSVQGSAKLHVDPDMARLWVEVSEEGQKADDVIARVRRKMDAVVSAVKSKGVSDKDLQTKHYQVTPKTRWDNGRSQRDGYMVSNQLEVKVHDLQKTGAIISAATDAGANSVNGPQFEIDNPKILERKALAMAMEDAKARASLLAEAAGAALGPVTQISENAGFMPGPQPVMMRAMAMAGRAADSAPEAIQSGQQDLTVTVNAVFALR